MPISSRSIKTSSATLGISLVISSSPNFVSLASISCSAMWTEVRTSSLTSLSEITIESSKLYPSHGIYPTSKFFPSANSPPWVLGPSAKTSPGFTFVPTLTSGF